MPGATHSRPVLTIGFAAISAWLWWMAWPGLFVYFEADDMMNLYKAWEQSWTTLLVSNLTPFTPHYRPAGAAVYRGLFEFFGLDPFPFRISAYLLMTLNVALTTLLARKLSGSVAIALLTALLAAFHHRAFDLYFNNGAIYDILCYAFSAAFLLLYISARPHWTWARSAGLYVLLTLALNSKEMALTLPALLWAYELIYFRPNAVRDLFTRDRLWAWIASIITLGAAVAKMASARSPLTGHPFYTPELSLTRYLHSTQSYLSDLFLLGHDVMSPLVAGSILVGIMALAIAWKRRDLRFAAAFILLTPLPVNFIAPRGFFVMYWPLLGWAMLLAILVLAAVPRRAWYAAIAVVALVLTFASRRDQSSRFYEGPFAKSIRRLHTDVLAAHPSLPPGSRVLFLQDEFTNEDWTPVFVLRLAYRDATLQVDRVKMMGKAPELAGYRHVFDYEGGQFRSR